VNYLLTRLQKTNAAFSFAGLSWQAKSAKEEFLKSAVSDETR
jgi:hypothetical protein